MDNGNDTQEKKTHCMKLVHSVKRERERERKVQYSFKLLITAANSVFVYMIKWELFLQKALFSFRRFHVLKLNKRVLNCGGDFSGFVLILEEQAKLKIFLRINDCVCSFVRLFVCCAKEN